MERLTGLFYHTRLSCVNRNPLKTRLFFACLGIFPGDSPHIFPPPVVYCWKGRPFPPARLPHGPAGGLQAAAIHDYEIEMGDPP